MSEPGKLHKRQLLRNFARAAEHYETFAVLSHEVLQRLMDRLAIMQLKPERVLDLGSGTGMSARALSERFPRAELFALDLSLPMLRRQHAHTRLTWQRLLKAARRPARIAGDFERLPLRDNAIDLIASNLALHWSAQVPRVFAEAGRVMRTGGLLIFSTLGPDTLKELRDATAGSSTSPVLDFVDMHDLGDALVGAGFADPVMEMERLTLTYPDLDTLWRDLRGTGGLSVAPLAGLRTPRWRQRVAERYEKWRRDDRLPATFEVIFGHAWKVPRRERTADGVAVIRFEPRSRRT